jgi:hypothetical protein
MDPAEKDKPYYRVTISNRDAWVRRNPRLVRAVCSLQL